MVAGMKHLLVMCTSCSKALSHFLQQRYFVMLAMVVAR